MHKRRHQAKRSVDLANGPGKLCAALGITGTMNGLSLRRKPIVIREGEPVAEGGIDVTSRIGIAPARSADWPLRWIVKNNHFVSHPVRRQKS
jgi:DNA-3-methyladenine glycosylase